MADTEKDVATAATPTTSSTSAASKVTEPKFSKRQLVKSQKYLNFHDLLNVLLDDDKLYTTAEVDKLKDDFLKKKVTA